MLNINLYVFSENLCSVARNVCAAAFLGRERPGGSLGGWAGSISPKARLPWEGAEDVSPILFVNTVGVIGISFGY